MKYPLIVTSFGSFFRQSQQVKGPKSTWKDISKAWHLIILTRNKNRANVL